MRPADAVDLLDLVDLDAAGPKRTAPGRVLRYTVVSKRRRRSAKRSSVRSA
jgi:hypothetical protein